MSVLVDGDPTRGDVEDVTVGNPSGGNEERLGFDDVTSGCAFEVDGDTARSALHALDVRHEPDVESCRVALGEPLREVAVQGGEQR